LHDLFAGDGPHAANWVMVALKSTDKPRWVLRTDADTIKFFGEGKIEITSRGNLKIGRITMQRKGGDAGRDTAKMLQFKINPALVFASRLSSSRASSEAARPHPVRRIVRAQVPRSLEAYSERVTSKKLGDSLCNQPWVL